MRTTGAAIFPAVATIVDASAPSEVSNVFTGSAVNQAIKNDVESDSSSVAGAWANTVVLFVGWTAVLFLGLGFLLSMVLGKKKPVRRRRRATTATRRRRTPTTRRRRTYKRRK